MKYCGECGNTISRRWLVSEGRERLVCDACGAVHYQNPRVIVCSAVHWGDRLLMCRRAHEPAKGQWSVPSGFLECGETLEEATARETFEETGVVIDPSRLELYAVTNMTAIEQVAIVFRVEITAEPTLRAGAECLEVAFLSEEDTLTRSVAWRDTFASEGPRFFAEMRSREFTIQLATIGSEGGSSFRSREYPIVPGPAGGNAKR